MPAGWAVWDLGRVSVPASRPCCVEPGTTKPCLSLQGPFGAWRASHNPALLSCLCNTSTPEPLRPQLEAKERALAAQSSVLDADLAAARATQSKDAVRAAHRALADCWASQGAVNEAMKGYMRMREFCTQPDHVLTMCIRWVRGGRGGRWGCGPGALRGWWPGMPRPSTPWSRGPSTPPSPFPSIIKCAVAMRQWVHVAAYRKRGESVVASSVGAWNWEGRGPGPR